LNAPRIAVPVVRAVAVRLALVGVAQAFAIAAYFSVISMYLKLPFGSGATPFVFATFTHLAAGNALFVAAALARRNAAPRTASTIGSLMPFAAVAFGAWAGTDPPSGRVLVSALLLAPAIVFSAWALPPSPSSGDAS
jgi:hypothetical protein